MSVMTLETGSELVGVPTWGALAVEPVEERSWGTGERAWSESVAVLVGGDEDLDEDESYFLEEDEDDDDEDGYDAGFLDDDEDDDLEAEELDTDEDDDEL